MKHFKLITLLAFWAITLQAADQKCDSSLVGQKAYDFKAQAVVDGETKDVSLSDFKDKFKILIFYPADFSFVCPTELFAFQDKKEEFDKRNAQLMAVSVDQVYSHQAWLEKPRNEGGIEGITYPLLSDVTKAISCAYGVLDGKKGISLRGVIIIDPKDIIQHVSINNESVGRSIDEVLRTLDGIIFTLDHGDVCPANWQKGQETIKPTEEGLKEYLKNQEKKKG